MNEVTKGSIAILQGHKPGVTLLEHLQSICSARSCSEASQGRPRTRWPLRDGAWTDLQGYNAMTGASRADKGVNRYSARA